MSLVELRSSPLAKTSVLVTGSRLRCLYPRCAPSLKDGEETKMLEEPGRQMFLSRPQRDAHVEDKCVVLHQKPLIICVDEMIANSIVVSIDAIIGCGCGGDWECF